LPGNGLLANHERGHASIIVRGTDVPRMAEKVERLRQTLSPTKFRQEVLVEMLSDGLSYFDLDCIARATNPDVKAFAL